MTGNGSNQERRQLWIAIIVSVIVFLAVSLIIAPLGDKIPDPAIATPSISPTFITDSPVPSATPEFTPSVTQTFTPSIEYTASPIPTPIRGVIETNVPENFIVENWHDGRVMCGRRLNYHKIQITGVDIFGARPPYQFTFLQSKEVIATRTVTENGTVEFSEPVLVKKGSYVHVTITFDSTDGGSFWSDDLFYPLRDNGCPNN